MADGREGWVNLFVGKGWDAYNSDVAVRRRSGFASSDFWPNEPTFLTYSDPFERFGIPRPPVPLPKRGS